ncbi:Flagellar motility protein MotE, a chaperone for MotC folding [Salinihabitans flavidus]|uniref:Flagellar motility protein MotE, a chaperone for MotC folding n=1 Tax=Salinihabitans flavidus TaxID=569882 RepID=A0A1H8LR56_9RHOB|nr:hypothetical protein [Salinihabitans flavidus]SEO07642.1 Flagellar motility protein MotE, a chaperone for MotC folding [Salinihabitans flavidus]
MTKAPKKTSGRRPGKGSLMVIALLLVGSALIRLGTEAGQAIAKESDPPSGERTELSQPANCEPPEDMRELLGVFRAREDRLVQREAEVRNRMQALSVADEQIGKRMTALQQAEERLRETIALADSAAEGDLSRLTEVYETMKSKEAAALFEEMDPVFAAGFLARMKPDAAAGIMAGLTPKSAYTISVVLAGRNANVPTE